MLYVALINTALYIFMCCISTNKVEPCGYTVPNISEIVSGIQIDPLPIGVLPRSVTANNIRIHYEYTDSFNNYVGATDLKRDVLEPARLSLQSMITVNIPISGILRVDRQCASGQYFVNVSMDSWCSGDCVATTKCMDVIVPDKYLKKCQIGNSLGITSISGSEGVGQPNVDIVLLVSYVQCPTGVLASATSCFQEGQLDRPILGILTLCSDMIIAGMNIRVNTIILKHEIIHALGFAVDKYAFYRNQDGTPIVPRDNYGRPNLGVNKFGFYIFNDKIAVPVNRSRSSVTMNYTSQFYAMVLPNIVSVAREHFNCASINEVDLEDAGSMGSAYSHFDELLLFNEIMTPEFSGWNDRLSKFTLALLKDTGWYGVDYSKADDLLYGKNVGCLLPLKGCYAFMESQRKLNLPLDPFCDTASGQILQCNPTRQYYEYCRIKQYSSVPTQYQYFKSLKGLVNYDPSSYAGHSEFSEYCPMKAVPYSIYDELNSDCTDARNNGKTNQYTPIISGYGSNSMCFDTTMIDQPVFGASCLNYSYTGNKADYSVCVAGDMLTCTGNSEYDIVNSYGLSATLPCLQPSSLATKQDNGVIASCQQYQTTICETFVKTKGTQRHQWSLTLAAVALATKLFAL